MLFAVKVHIYSLILLAKKIKTIFFSIKYQKLAQKGFVFGSKFFSKG